MCAAEDKCGREQLNTNRQRAKGGRPRAVTRH